MKKVTLKVGLPIAIALIIAYIFLSRANVPSVILINSFFQTASNIPDINMNKTQNININSESTKNVGENSLVQIKEIEEGTGALVEQNSDVRLSYKGFLVNSNGEETVFDENFSGEVVFQLGQRKLIQGFEAGLVGMRENGTRLIIIQPEAGYGDIEIGSIPANSVLHFIVEVHEVQK